MIIVSKRTSCCSVLKTWEVQGRYYVLSCAGRLHKLDIRPVSFPLFVSLTFLLLILQGLCRELKFVLQYACQVMDQVRWTQNSTGQPDSQQRNSRSCRFSFSQEVCGPQWCEREVVRVNKSLSVEVIET